MTTYFIDFLQADKEWDDHCAACSTYHEAAGYAKQRQEKWMSEYLKWKCCKGALEWFDMDLNDSGDMRFTGLNHELCGEWLADGQDSFERKMAAALVSAGTAAEEWIENMSHYECHKASKEKREKQLRKKYNKQKEEG